MFGLAEFRSIFIMDEGLIRPNLKLACLLGLVFSLHISLSYWLISLMLGNPCVPTCSHHNTDDFKCQKPIGFDSGLGHMI